MPGIRYLRTSVAPIDVTTWAGAPVTTVERTVVDCLVLLPDRPASDLLDRALNRDLLTGNALAEAVRDRVGRRGTKRLLRYLRRIRGGSRSEAERVAIGLLRKAGLSGWTVNSPIEDAAGLVGIGDLVFAAARLVVELDGWAYHMTSQQFQRDRTRQNRLIRAGWTVLRFTWLDLTERPEYVIATIRSVLDRE